MTARIAMVDYGMGNRRSVVKAFAHIGTEIAQTADAGELCAADGLIVPGVGAFPEAMRRLRALGLDDVVRERAAAGVPVIGLCLGMQLLFEESVEHEGSTGLGLLPGRIVRLETAGLKLPHIGWNAVTWQRESALVAGLPNPAAFYHVHSFVPVPDDESIVLGMGEYGAPFVSFVERDNVFGAQCHPEKSSTHGLALLRNFVGICSTAAAVA
ncbi:MAG TPA: imidazole glycerol phosphate synthase subunit HisH [Solirubrobacteraceae bacterium]|nr:imidazole glycerol phosphate synthase subunit HisH [Solirubrobacteraceae bacterium]